MQEEPGRERIRKALVKVIGDVNQDIARRQARMKAILARMDAFRVAGNLEHWEAYLPRLRGHEYAICDLFTRRARLVKALYVIQGVREAG